MGKMKNYISGLIIFVFCVSWAEAQYVYKGVDLFSFAHQEGFSPCKNNADEFCKDSVEYYSKVVIIPASEKIIFRTANNEETNVKMYRELSELFGRYADEATGDHVIWDFKKEGMRVMIDYLPGLVQLYSFRTK